jgi:hypothetical protein
MVENENVGWAELTGVVSCMRPSMTPDIIVTEEIGGRGNI